jgi:CBS domain-containing protein
MIKVAELMTRNPHTLLISNTFGDAKKLMSEYDIRHIPVVDVHNKLLGLVTQRDILAAQDSNLQDPSSDSSYLLTAKLERATGEDILTVSPHAGLRECAVMMQKRKVGCLPVVLNQKLIGIITDTDFVEIAINLLELQEEVEPTDENS